MKKRKMKNEKRKNNILCASVSSVRKISFFSFLFALFSLLFVSCPDLIEIKQLPQGHGSFTAQFNNSRTIMPSLDLTDFKFFELIFTPTLNGEARTVIFANNGVTLPAVILVAGTYNITLNAYLDGTITAPTDKAASGTANDVVITAGTSISRNIELNAIATGTGTFEWDIDLNGITGTLTTATMAIIGGATSKTIYLLDEPSGGIKLASGTYNIEITLVKDSHRAIWYEMLYIFDNLESTFAKEFDDDFFHQTHYVVTYDHNYTGSTNTTQTVIHGSGTVAKPTNPARSGYTFFRWYTDSTLTVPVEFPITVANDITLYAEWAPGTVNIITNQAELAAINTNTTTLAGNYWVGCDFTISGSWTPIGSTSTPFIGTLDGNGKTITISSPTISSTAQLIGIFAGVGAQSSTVIGTVKNLRLEGTIRVVGDFATRFAGAVTGANTGIIRNVRSSVNIETQGRNACYAGGIAGQNGGQYGRITNCYNTGNIIAQGVAQNDGIVAAGGIAGMNYGVISFCWSSGTVNASWAQQVFAGGILGYANTTDEILSQCVALNTSVTAASAAIDQFRFAGRVYGNRTGTTYANYASDMTLSGGTLNAGANTKDGATVLLSSLSNNSWWNNTAGWTVNANKAAASEDSPWYWPGTTTRPLLWFE